MCSPPPCNEEEPPRHAAHRLCKPPDESKFQELFFAETTTLACAVTPPSGASLPREWETVATCYGEVRMKLARVNGQVLQASPEYEDCRKLAEEKRCRCNASCRKPCRRGGKDRSRDFVAAAWRLPRPGRGGGALCYCFRSGRSLVGPFLGRSRRGAARCAPSRQDRSCVEPALGFLLTMPALHPRRKAPA